MNLAFFGGIHYGFGSAQYDVVKDEQEKSAVRNQLGYSFVPGIISFAASNWMLFANPLTLKDVTLGFTALMLIQLLGLKFDQACVSKNIAPVWFKKYRERCFVAYMAVSVLMFTVFYKNHQMIQRRNDPNRIENLQSALKLEDVDFVKMVGDLKIEFDESELSEVEK